MYCVCVHACMCQCVVYVFLSDIHVHCFKSMAEGVLT